MEESRKTIANELARLRYENSRSFDLPRDQNILAEFYKLAIYCFATFPIPESHLEYIDRHLVVDFTDSSKSKPSFFSKKNAVQDVPKPEMTRQLIIKWQETRELFSLELPLRAVEVLFTWGHFDLSEEQIKIVYSLIESLRNSIEDNKKKDAA